MIVFETRSDINVNKGTLLSQDASIQKPHLGLICQIV